MGVAQVDAGSVRRGAGAALRRLRRAAAGAPVSVDVPMLALTFDDGPHPTRTPAILDALAASGVSATFFVIGEEAEKYPEIVRRMVADGHAIGTHSMTHPDLHKVSSATAMADIRAGRVVVERIVGRSVPMFRPPKGHLTLDVGLRLRRGDWRTWLWSVDTYDWKAGATPSSVLAAAKVAGDGDVVVMHDTTLAAVEAIVPMLHHARQAGWNLQPLT